MNEDSIQITTTAYTDIGSQRKTNEDSYYISENENLLIVCDGMGGHVAGGLASKIAVETIKDVFFTLQEDHLNRLFTDIDQSLSKPARLLIAAVRIANRRLYNMATRFPKLRGMGTTVVAIAFDHDAATLVHVGDSRVFRISDETITQLTEDHSWLNELIEDNEINEEQIETFSQKNVITRALGTAPTLKVDLHSEKYKKDDIYVLCTDGLHNAIKPEEISKAFKNSKSSLNNIAKKLVEKAKSIDGSDNITTAVAKIGQDCDTNGQIGISTTISAEDPKNGPKIDRFIHEKFGDSRVGLFGRARANGTHRTYLTIGLALLCSIVFFVIGLTLRSSSRAPARYPGADLHAQNGSVTTVPATPVEHKDGLSKRKPEHGNNGTPANGGIYQSSLTNGATIAVVFFNNSDDYERSELEKRALVLDKFQPYKHGAKQWSQNHFTIFLIDSRNNVIRKTTGLEIPEYSGIK